MTSLGTGPSLAQLEQDVQKVRRRRWVLGVLGIPTLVFGGLMIAAAAGAFDAWDQEALARGEWVRRAPATQVADGQPDASHSVSVLRSSDPLRHHIGRWVAAFDSLSPGVITQWDVDAYGNLLVMFDARYDALPPERQLRMLDQLGGYYRMHLAALVGDIPRSTGFVPGIIVIDTNPANPAIRAENRNGRVSIYSR